jgi:hypothetical protein
MAMSVSSSVRRAEKENSVVELWRRKPHAKKKKGLRPGGWLKIEKEIKSVNRAGKSWLFHSWEEPRTLEESGRCL